MSKSSDKQDRWSGQEFRIIVYLVATFDEEKTRKKVFFCQIGRGTVIYIEIRKSTRLGDLYNLLHDRVPRLLFDNLRTV